MYKETWKNYYFQEKPLKVPQKWILLRKVAKDKLSEKGQEKLEWIIFYNTIGNKKATYTADYFGITRKTLHKWLSRFDEKNLLTLEEKSRAPQTKREWEVTVAEEENIKVLRKKNMEFGKKKLKVLYKKEYEKEISTWKIEKVIRKWQLYPKAIEYKKRYEKQRQSASKVRIHTVKEKLSAVEEFGFLWHIDAIICQVPNSLDKRPKAFFLI